MNVIARLVSRIVSAFQSEDCTPSGADAVRTALDEIEDLAGKNLNATLGEPDIVEDGNQFFSDVKVVIPIADSPYDGSHQLVFDLPDGRDDDESEFNQLLDCLGVSLDTIEDLAGQEVPVHLQEGNVVVSWSEADSRTDKGAEENSSDSTGVTVEERNISTEDE